VCTVWQRVQDSGRKRPLIQPLPCDGEPRRNDKFCVRIISTSRRLPQRWQKEGGCGHTLQSQERGKC
jgi:hypothetical protein